MLYKEYGKTGKKISVIGMGGMRFIPADGDKYDYDKCAELVIKASELGINFFDTAPGYNNDASENIFGHAFKSMPKEFYVSTKSMKKNGDDVRRQIETSLQRLSVPKINFFNIWCILNLDDYRNRMIKGGAYEAALRAKEEGLIEHIIFSTHCSGDEIETIIKEGCFEGVTLGYNILNFPYRQKGIKAAYENGLGVATMNPLGGGLIPQNPGYFDFIKNAEDENVVQAAIRFNASQKEITTVLPGMGTIEEVIENARLGDDITEFHHDRIKEIENRLFKSMDSLCTGCGYCKGCPENIEIPKFMIAYNQSIIGSVSDGLNWMKWHWWMSTEQAAKCVECGLCEEQCTQHLPIIDRLKEIKSWA